MWKFELIKEMQDPAKQIFADDKIVIVKDTYPKAERHFLVLPKQDISSCELVKKDDIELLKHMDSKGRDIASKYGDGRTFKIGYHAVPSMVRLHLHVVSDDFNSPFLKHKKHWNSFTTPFFMDSDKVIGEVETLGKVAIPPKSIAENYLKNPLKCHKCDYLPKHMPDLKNHILKHLRVR